jgi:hypothetical protein
VRTYGDSEGRRVMEGMGSIPKGHDYQNSPHNQTMRKRVHDIGNITACPPVAPETPVRCGVPPPPGAREEEGERDFRVILKHTHLHAHLHP